MLSCVRRKDPSAPHSFSSKEVVDGALVMHINYRRKNKPPVEKCRTHCRHHYPFGLYSYKALRQEFWRRARAQARHLMVHDLYDELPASYRRDILWDYW